MHTSKEEKFPLEMFHQNIAEILTARAGTEIRVHCKTGSPLGRLVRKDHFIQDNRDIR
jgi:hypothetical protein